MHFKNIMENENSDLPLDFLHSLEPLPLEYQNFIFSLSINQQFLQNLQFLASEETISPKMIDQWQKKNFVVVAQTIDGDYVGGTSKQTFVIPTSLFKTDIETYSYPLADFFDLYFSGSIHSNILPAQMK